MRLRLFSIHDRLLGVYLAPFVARAEVEAIRNVKSTMSDPQMVNQPLVTNAQDYALVCLGFFDDVTGAILQDEEGGPGFPVEVVRLAVLRNQLRGGADDGDQVRVQKS